ncbi:uncharacterized protein LOC125656907 isoform X4 [Ostrea edulis]|uniref:uncharacterized protein LOC125656907 isoform X4 n=1 Tax=Ostrea edulis TaxID=37623 RepID=UPI0024AEF994|nr:uncharacterized protein LOC125656907 isoform X4 [Ostrea edulis]
MGNAQSEEDRLFFFEQCSEQPLIKKRYRKLPEDLPEGLKFAHLHPKVAALYAQKERESQRAAEKDPFGDGLGSKSLLPNINQAVTHIKNRLDSALSNDEDSQRFLFEDTKASAASILQQLSKYLYFYEGIASHVPKSLEYQLMSSWKELTNDVIIVPREWQTTEIRDQYYNSIREAHSDDDSDNEIKMGKSSEKLDSKSKAKRQHKMPIPDIIEDEFRPDKPANRRSESRMSTVSISRGRLDVKGLAPKGLREHRGSIAGVRSPGVRKQTHDDLISNFGETPSDPRSTAMTNPSFGQQVVINFAISSKLCQDKGWIIEKGKPEVEPQKVYENCIQILRDFMKKIETDQKEDSDKGHDKEVLVRYYGDYKKEVLLKYRKTPVKPQINPIFKTGKPKIPPLHEERNQGKKLLQATHQDGTSVVYYPSGRSAVVYCSAGAELGRPGYYLIAYDDTNDHRMLACFTPAGRGVCYSTNGNIRFLSTEKGGHLAETDGTIVRKWKWPVNNVKLTTPINIQLNGNLVFRCNSQHSLSLMFSCQKELARFSVGPVPGAIESKPGDENEQLLMTFTYTSKAARDMMRLFAPKHKQRSKKAARRQKGHLAEIQKLLVDFPDKVQYELESDKELARLQRKARNLVDDWLEHYRLAVGLKSPHILNVRDSPDFSSRARNIQSAKLADVGQAARLKHLGLETLLDFKKQRTPSAPIEDFVVKDRSETSKSLDIETGKSKKSQRSGNQSAVKFDDSPQEEEGDGDNASPTALAMFERLSQSAGKRSARSNASAASSAPLSRQHTATYRSETSQNIQTARIPCPIALRQRILGLDQTSCRCSRHYIPQIMDIEYNEFIQIEAPDGQLIVISVVSSLFPHSSTSDQMIEEIYLSQNRNRTKPCVQSRMDMFRILQYDINTASEGSNHTQPLLLTRHNVVPGMFLIYLAGKLLFCDHIFNGYGNARKDFKKQLMRSKVEALQGFSLPKDFRFSPSRGRSGMRSAWGGEIGGTGVDHYGNPGTAFDSSLIPLSRSLSSLTDDKKEAPIDSVKEIYVKIGPLLNMQSLNRKRRVDTCIVPILSIPGEFRELDPRRNLSAPGRRLVQGSVT